jgi:hypothetical protein
MKARRDDGCAGEPSSASSIRTVPASTLPTVTRPKPFFCSCSRCKMSNDLPYPPLQEGKPLCVGRPASAFGRPRR